MEELDFAEGWERRHLVMAERVLGTSKATKVFTSLTVAQGYIQLIFTILEEEREELNEQFIPSIHTLNQKILTMLSRLEQETGIDEIRISETGHSIQDLLTNHQDNNLL